MYIVYVSRGGSNSSIAGVRGEAASSVVVGDAAISTKLPGVSGILPLTGKGAVSGFYFTTGSSGSALGFVNNRGVIAFSLQLTRPTNIAWLNETAGTFLVTTNTEDTVLLLTPFSFTLSSTRSPSQTQSQTQSQAQSLSRSQSQTQSSFMTTSPSQTLSKIGRAHV